MIHSSDGVRERIYGDEAVVGDFNEVFRILYEEVDGSISEDRDVIIDNTRLCGGRLRHPSGDLPSQERPEDLLPRVRVPVL